MVERERFAFKLAVEYEWMPDFCFHCQIIGHGVTACRWIMPKQASEKVDCGKKPAPAPKRTSQKFMEKENTDGICSSKAFSVPALTTIPNDSIPEMAAVPGINVSSG